MRSLPAPLHVSVAALEDYCLRVLRRLAVSDGHARVITDALVTTDSWAIFTHGTKLLGGYARRLQEGGLRTDCQPQVTGEGPAWALVDLASHLGIDLFAG